MRTPPYPPGPPLPVPLSSKPGAISHKHRASSGRQRVEQSPQPPSKLQQPPLPAAELPRNVPTVSDTVWAVNATHRYGFADPGVDRGADCVLELRCGGAAPTAVVLGTLKGPVLC